MLAVEVYQGQPLSFMTERCVGLLAELSAVAEFVPATTRTRAQYLRAHLPGPVPGWAPHYAICANGGHLLIDGKTDQDWLTHTKAELAQAGAPLAEVAHEVTREADPRWTRGSRVAEDLFAYLVVEPGMLPPGWLEQLTGWAAERGWHVSLQGAKLYAIPQSLTKGAALAEVRRRTGASHVLATGDSLLDVDLLLAADAGYLPGHGQLADSGWTAPRVTTLAEAGVAAGEEIVRRLLACVLADPGPGT